MVTIGDKISELPSLVSINGTENIPVQKGGKNYKVPASIFKNIIAMGIKKSYTSVTAMQADGTSPVGNDGEPLNAGDLVSIYNTANPDDPDNNSIYAFKNPNWEKQLQQFAVDSELNPNSNNAIKNSAVAKMIIRIDKILNESTIINFGEFAYRTDEKLLKYNDNGNVIIVPFVKGALYSYKEKIYYWDFEKSDLLEFFPADTQLNPNSGNSVSNSIVASMIIPINRFVSGATQMTVGEYIYKPDEKVIKYNDNGKVVVVSFIKGALYTYQNGIYQWDFNKQDMVKLSTAIDNKLNPNSGNAISNNVVATELNTIQFNSPEDILLEVGGYDINDGEPAGLTTRANTMPFIKAPFYIKASGEYRVSAALPYVKNMDGTYTFQTGHAFLGTRQDYSSDGKDYQYWIIGFKKGDGGTEDITQDELPNIISEFTHDIFGEDVDNSNGLYISSGGVGTFETYNELISAYDKLLSSYSEFVTKNDLGATNEAGNIYEYVISSGQYNINGRRGKRDSEIKKPKFMIMSGIHGDEKSAVSSLYMFVKDILNNTSLVSQILGNIELHVIPCACPYGFDHNQRTNSNGVNINRNFNASWVKMMEGTNDYSGTSAASELETQILQKWIDDNIDAEFVIDYHNSGFTNEMSCIATYSNDIEGTDIFKKQYLVSVEACASMLVNMRKVPKDSIIAYTTVDSSGGMSHAYVHSKGVKGCYYETSNKIGSNPYYDAISITVGADTLGNMMIGYYRLYNISNI